MKLKNEGICISYFNCKLKLIILMNHQNFMMIDLNQNNPNDQNILVR